MPTRFRDDLDLAPRARARQLRADMTEPERRLCNALRRRLPVGGSHFRRQVPLGPYIADFCCLAARLVIEVDGEQHGFDAERARDEARTRYLAERGLRVLRFTNRDILTAMDVVLDTVYAAVQEGAAKPREASPRRQGQSPPSPLEGEVASRASARSEGGREGGTSERAAASVSSFGDLSSRPPSVSSADTSPSRGEGIPLRAPLS